jgi:hypothetical protein
MKNITPRPATAEPVTRRNPVALLREADAALEILHRDPASCEHLSLRHISTVRELLTRIQNRAEDISADLFGGQ